MRFMVSLGTTRCRRMSEFRSIDLVSIYLLSLRYFLCGVRPHIDRIAGFTDSSTMSRVTSRARLVSVSQVFRYVFVGRSVLDPPDEPRLARLGSSYGSAYYVPMVPHTSAAFVATFDARARAPPHTGECHHSHMIMVAGTRESERPAAWIIHGIHSTGICPLTRVLAPFFSRPFLLLLLLSLPLLHPDLLSPSSYFLRSVLLSIVVRVSLSLFRARARTRMLQPFFRLRSATHEERALVEDVFYARSYRVFRPEKTFPRARVRAYTHRVFYER